MNITARKLIDQLLKTEEGKYPWGISKYGDGWSEDELDEIGLMGLIEDVEKVAYEIRNARRGSYANFGDTIEDLSIRLAQLGRDFIAVSEDIARQS